MNFSHLAGVLRSGGNAPRLAGSGTVVNNACIGTLRPDIVTMNSGKNSTIATNGRSGRCVMDSTGSTDSSVITQKIRCLP
jgi:hypothetical protein